MGEGELFDLGQLFDAYIYRHGRKYNLDLTEQSGDAPQEAHVGVRLLKRSAAVISTCAFLRGFRQRLVEQL